MQRKFQGAKVRQNKSSPYGVFPSDSKKSWEQSPSVVGPDYRRSEITTE